MISSVNYLIASQIVVSFFRLSETKFLEVWIALTRTVAVLCISFFPCVSNFANALNAVQKL
jgi:hypothetical protein